MEFMQGQVFGIGRITEHIKNVKTKKELDSKRDAEIDLFNHAKDEIAMLKSNLDYTSDADAIESSIYRLMAAEIDLNRQLRDRKTLFRN